MFRECQLPCTIMIGLTSLSMFNEIGANDVTAKFFDNALVSKAHPQDRNNSSKSSNHGT